MSFENYNNEEEEDYGIEFISDADWLTTCKIQFCENYGKNFITGNISIEDYISRVGNPSDAEDMKFTEIRQYKKGHSIYDDFKAKRRCYLFNGWFNNTRGLNNLVQQTGFLFIDIDDVDFHISSISREHYYIAHRSYGGRGWSIIVKIGGGIFNKRSFDLTYRQIVDFMGISNIYDKACVDIARITVSSIDYDIVVNPDCVIYKIVEVPEDEISIEGRSLNVSVSGNAFKGVIPLEFTDDKLEPSYKLRIMMAHAFVGVFGKDSIDAKNFFLECCGLSDNRGRHTDKDHYYQNGIGLWANASSKEDILKLETNIQYSRLVKRFPGFIKSVKLNELVFDMGDEKYITYDEDNLIEIIKDKKRIVLKSDPGTGKSSIVKGRKLQELGKITLAMPSTILTNQQMTLKLCKDIGLDINDITIYYNGIPMPDNWLTANILCCCYESVPKFTKRGGVLIVDEIQHLLNDISFRLSSLRKLESCFQDFIYIILASGTPLNLANYPGFVQVTYNKKYSHDIPLYNNYNLLDVITTNADDKFIVFNNHKEKNNSVIKPLFESFGKTVLLADKSNKSTDGVNELIETTYLKEDILLGTVFINDGINISQDNNTWHIIFEGDWKPDQIVQGINRIRMDNRQKVFAYYNKEYNIETNENPNNSNLDYITQIKQQQIAKYNKELLTLANPEYVTSLHSTDSIYYDHKAGEYKLSYLVLLKERWTTYCKYIDWNEYTKSYGITIINLTNDKYVFNKIEKNSDDDFNLLRDLTLMLNSYWNFNITEEHLININDENLSPEMLLQRYDRQMKEFGYTTPMARYINNHNLGHLHKYIYFKQLISWANNEEWSTLNFNNHVHKVDYMLYKLGIVKPFPQQLKDFKAYDRLDKILTNNLYSQDALKIEFNKIPELKNLTTDKIKRVLGCIRDFTINRVGKKVKTSYYSLERVSLRLQLNII